MSPDALRRELDAFLGGFDFAAHRARDPVAFAHRYAAPADQALVGLFAALLAYGRADLIARALADVTARMGPAPAAAALADDEAAARERFGGFVYRFTRGDDLARLWLGAAALVRRYGNLGAAFAHFDEPAAPDLRPALAGFRTALLAPTAGFPARGAFRHLVPDPAAGSACKRFNLYLRWMVRGPDAVDLGLWREHVAPARLVVPLDTHVHRIGRYLGLTRRRQADWRTAAEITASLRRLDPSDPVRYDFALAHMGISGACPTRRVASICCDCPIRGVCRLDEAGEARDAFG